MSDDFSLHVEKISGLPSDNSICGVLTKRVTLSDSRAGTLVSCILVSGEGADLSGVLPDIFEITQKKLEESNEGILEALKSAIASSRRYNPGLEINFVHTFFFEDVCYISRLGDKVKLFVFHPPKSVEISFEFGSGPVSGGQMYLLATDAFLSIFDTSVFAQEAEVDFEEIIDGAATEIAGEENQAEIGAGFVQVAGLHNIFDSNSALVEEADENVEVIEENGQKDEDKQSIDVPEQAAVENIEVSIENNPEPAEATVEGAAEQVSETKKRRVLSFSKITSPIFSELGKIRRGDIGVIRKNVGIFAVIVVLVLLGSVGFAVWQNMNAKKTAEFDTHYAAASQKYEEANAILSLSKQRARDLFVEADSEVKAAIAIKKKDEKAQKLALDITAKLKETETSQNVSFDQVADVDDSINSLGIAGKNIAAISASKLFEVNVSGKVEKIDLKTNSQSAFVYDNKAFLVSDGKISKQDLVSGKISDVAATADKPLDISVFFGNVYTLSGGGISKFVPTESGYSSGTAYLASTQSFSAKSHFAIDSSIWVTNGTNILKFTRGEKQDFAISGLVGSLGELSLIYTSSDADNIYAVDSTNSALVVVGKDGSLKKIMQDGQFAKATDLVVDEGAGTIYIAVGSKIFKTAL